MDQGIIATKATNFMIAQPIPSRTKILLTSICLLLITACKCQQQSLGSGEIDYGAELAINQVELSTIVKTDAGLQYIISFDGIIEKNHLQEGTTAGVIIIPRGEDIKTAAEELQNIKQPHTPNTSIPLLNGRGLAYYSNNVDSEYTGNVTGKYTPDTLQAYLTADTQYDTYLILRRSNEECIYYSKNNTTLHTPPDSHFVAVAMDTANAIRNPAGIIQVDLVGKVTALPRSASAHVGFLLLKKNSTTMSLDKLASEFCLKQDSLPARGSLQTLTDYPGVIFYLDNPLLKRARLFGRSGIDDINHDLERGATYQVYAYATYTNAGKQYYTLSSSCQEITNPKPQIKPAMKSVSGKQYDTSNSSCQKITTLKPEVELAMKSVTIDSLVHLIDNNQWKLSATLTGSITKHEGTTNPLLGFLMVPNSPIRNLVTAKTYIQSIPRRASGLYSDNTRTIYVVGSDNRNIGDRQVSLDINHTSNYGLHLGRTYYIYCWIQDQNGQGEIFVNDRPAQLAIPNDNFDVRWVEKPNTKLGKFSMRSNTQLQRRASAIVDIGYLFYEDLAPHAPVLPSLSDLQYVLSCTQKNLLVGQIGSSSRKRFFNLNNTETNLYDILENNTQYSLYHWVKIEEALLCKSTLVTKDNTFKVGEKWEPISYIMERVLPDSGKTYFINRKDFTIYCPATGENLDPNNESDQEIMYKLLKNVETDSDGNPENEIKRQFGLPEDYTPSPTS